MSAADLYPVEALVRPADRFRCVPYAAVITARTCLTRRAATFTGGRMKGHTPEQRTAYPACASCPLGARVAERVELPDETPRCACGAPVPDAGKRTPRCRDCRRSNARRPSP